MSDTWSDIQEHKRKQESLRERLQKRRRERQGIGLSETDGSSTPPPSSPQSIEDSSSGKKQPEFVKVDPQLENSLIACLWDSTFIFPVDSVVITNHLKNQENAVNPTREAIQNLLEKLAIQDFICIKPGTAQDGRPCVIVTEKDHSKLDAVAQELNLADKTANTRKRKRESESSDAVKDVVPAKVKEETQDDLQKLLSQPTMKEQESKKVGLDILDLLNVPSHKEQGIAQKFKSQGGAFVHEFCEHGTHEDCRKNKKHGQPCKKVHFRKILQKHTDETLGDCSFLNTCFHMDTCKYVHYEVDYNDMAMKRKEEMEKDKLKDEVSSSKEDSGKIILYPPQWISCDVRSLQMDVLGKFSVIMADPPWDIHMELPYGTMSDDEMRNLSVPSLQDNGYIFLWVTGRAMELGRECLEIWGYERCDELIWVKTNQLQRLIRTGRTGHWINHGKEHCLTSDEVPKVRSVLEITPLLERYMPQKWIYRGRYTLDVVYEIGVKGDTTGFNRGMDCDVLVAEVRETSHKPDEIYGLIERLSPGTRKIELFGRQHNVQPNWITLGNQLDGVRLLDPEVVARFKKRYPDGNPMTKKPS